jgi:hypothetical protein
LWGLQAAEETIALRGKDLGGRAEGGEAAVAEKQNFSSGGERVGGVVRGHDGLYLIDAQPSLQADKQRVAGDTVEGGKRLIEKKQTWSGRERASQSDSLRLATGEILRAASGEVGCANKIQHFVDAARAGSAINPRVFGAAQTVGHVGGNGKVRKERGLLRDKRSLAMAWWQAERDGSFGERATVEGDAAVDRVIEASEQAKQCALACA